MSNAIIVGTQWGDEGKGKIVDLITERFDIVARYQGGHNAGHTVCISDRQFILHLIPSGILHSEKSCVIGNGVVIDPAALNQELRMLSEAGISTQGRLFISNRAHLILPYHSAVEEAEERSRGPKAIGTTSRGIGPCYEDKMARRGLRVGDLQDPERFRQKLSDRVKHKNRLLELLYKAPLLDADAIFERTMQLAPSLLSYATDTAEYLFRAMDEGKSVLFEGAQGTQLDVDHGTYPFVTSSNATAGGACAGTGVGPSRIHGVIGIAKAYTTRVGGGPFPTELSGGIGERIREKGAEYGASTGRPRRCGWFDAVVVRYAGLINHLSTLVITKLDVLDVLDEIRICVGYKHRGKALNFFPTDMEILSQVEPVYESHPGWQTDTSRIHDYDELPQAARSYLNRLSELVGADISIISLGPNRDETIILEESPRLKALLT
ncbi:MAG: adenylosuccinate synthase [Acidobacteriota bacterium]